MKLEGSQTIAADKATIWASLNDPEVLKACIPGCQSLERTSETGLEAVVKQKVGPVSATFHGVVELSNLNPPNSYTITGEGKGCAAGFANGGADVSLEETAEGTVLSYVVEAKVGGKIAQLGARLIDGFAKKMADQFFTKFKETVEGPAPEAAPDPAAEPAAGAAPETAVADAAPDAAGGAAPEKKKGFWKRMMG